MRKKQKGSVNYLDLIPAPSPSVTWHRDFRDRVVLKVERKGIFHRAAKAVTGCSPYLKLHLDEMGSFLWPKINGRDNVESLARQVEEAFGDKAQPLYPRLVTYLQTLEANGLIHWDR